MPSNKSVFLKGELHSSSADLREELALLNDDVDVLVLEQSESPMEFRFLEGWFFLSIALLTWLLVGLFQSKEVLLELAAVQGIAVEYTRTDNAAPVRSAPTSMKAIAAGLFYLLVPGSLWIGFLTRDNLAGSLLLFLGLVLPVLVLRIYNTNRHDRVDNRDERIAETIITAGEPDDTVVAIVGAGHLHEVKARLPDRYDVTVRPPSHGVWSVGHLRDVGLPTVKAGLVLFSMYVGGVWVVVRAVELLTPLV